MCLFQDRIIICVCSRIGSYYVPEAMGNVEILHLAQLLGQNVYTEYTRTI